MADGREAREDEFRTCVARTVQAMRHRRIVPLDVAQLAAPVRHLAGLVDSGASMEELRDAAEAVVDAYEWPLPADSGSEEGTFFDPAILAAVERLRAAIDAMDEENGL